MAEVPLHDRLAALTTFLRDHHALWQPRPFMLAARPPWAADEPALAAWLTHLDDEAIDAFEASGEPPSDAPPFLLDLARRSAELTAVPSASDTSPTLDRRLGRFVPGRKWAQIAAFSRIALAHPPPDGGRWVDWCAGKGHLGRTLSAASGKPVTLVELEAGYADDATSLGARAGAEVRFFAADALGPTASTVLGPDTAVVALHACGGLTDALLVAAAEREVRSLTVSPCCHGRHRPEGAYVPLSRAGREAGLPLAVHDLRLATAETVSAPARERRARRRERAYRMAFDLLLREATGRDAYTPLGALATNELNAQFMDFCQIIAARIGAPLPPPRDPERALAAGDALAQEARALGLLRGIFRRPLELWVVAERALWLVERGRPAEIRTFCDRAVTPRNLVVTTKGLMGGR